MSVFTEIFRSVGATKLIVAIGLVFVMVMILILAGGKFSSKNNTLLAHDITQEDSGKIVAKLEEMNVPYELKGDGTQIYVPSDQALRLRVMMAQEGLGANNGVGYEIFDQGDKLVSNQFVQNINHLRALEGELARTIATVSSVKAARVHLVLPERQLFSREQQEASASVIIKTKGAPLSRENVNAIQHLVASAVPGLTPGRISIVDDKGNLLAKGENSADQQDTGSNSEELRLGYQNRFVRQIEEILERVVGPGKTRAEVALEMDLDRVTENSEIYDPQGQVVRSTQTSEESSKASNKAEQPVTVQQNLPEGVQTNASGAAKSESDTSRTEEKTNYEISKTVRVHVRETGMIKRVSVAVVVDGTYTIGDDKKKVYVPRTPEEMQKIEALVKSAIGFNAERGDKVEVINLQFASLDDEFKEDKTLFGMKTDEVMSMFQVVVLAIVGILFLLLIARPLIKRLVETIPTAATQAQLLTSQLAAVDERMSMPGPEGLPMLMSRDGIPMPEADFDAMIDIGRVEGKVRASSIKKVGEIIDRHTDESVAILRNWIYQDSE